MNKLLFIAVFCFLANSFITFANASCTSFSSSDNIGWIYCNEDVKREEAIEECASFGYSLAEINSALGLAKLSLELYDSSIGSDFVYLIFSLYFF